MVISFKGAQFPKEFIPFAVFFHVRYTVSCRDLEEILAVALPLMRVILNLCGGAVAFEP